MVSFIDGADGQVADQAYDEKTRHQVHRPVVSLVPRDAVLDPIWNPDTHPFCHGPQIRPFAAHTRGRETPHGRWSFRHTVLIAAAFCMFNRYVDGLGTSLPADPADYEASGVRLAEIGYVQTDYRKFRGDWKRP